MNRVKIIKIVHLHGIQYECFDENGVDRFGDKGLPKMWGDTLKRALENGMGLELVEGNNGKFRWKQVSVDGLSVVGEPTTYVNPGTAEPAILVGKAEDISNHAEFKTFIANAASLKPKTLFMKDINWKYLVRTVLRGRNIMMTGPTGCGKTMAVKSVISALDKPSFTFNLGASQDPRGMLIGNTSFNDGEGTIFNESDFVKAIKTENAIILLDELTRAHPEAHNILMSVTDYTQRYLRIDEKNSNEDRIVEVADGVTFIATANIGAEYTATRQLDRAMADRFTIIEMNELTEDQEIILLEMMYPDVPKSIIKSIANIAVATRDGFELDSCVLTDKISTRVSVEAASLAYDDFSIAEIADICFYPYFPDPEERIYVTQIVDKHIVDTNPDDNLFVTLESDSDKTPF